MKTILMQVQSDNDMFPHDVFVRCDFDEAAVADLIRRMDAIDPAMGDHSATFQPAYAPHGFEPRWVDFEGMEPGDSTAEEIVSAFDDPGNVLRVDFSLVEVHADGISLYAYQHFGGSADVLRTEKIPRSFLESAEMAYAEGEDIDMQATLIERVLADERPVESGPSN